MTDRELSILEAAWKVFLRYGVKRAGMTDIATEAGVSRQTLYNSFKGKNDILEAMIQHVTAKSIALIRAKMDAGAALPELLDTLFHEMVISPYELVAQLPNAEEFVHGTQVATNAAMTQSNLDYVAVLQDAFAPHAQAIAHHGETVETLAEFVQVSAFAAKKVVRDRAHLDTVLATLKNTALRMAGVTG